jgi:2-polyprenyl-3-methyl-5-hydroxy-6-metoxy-1,4-benzoquinol methylase
LLDQQIRQPAAERRHRDSIHKITPIDDRTSISVKEQYEENPYPRWISLPPPAPALPVDEVMQRDYPYGDYHKTGKTTGFDVLIAGCGTGYHSILFSQTLPGARVLAIDLSLSSLCYAKQKTQAMGLSNIEYVQGDILELGNLGRTFDVISSSGVLHHLADPERGWRTLLPLLRSNGCMHIGLYSEIARRDLIAAQAWLRTSGYNSSHEDIRRARQELAAAATHDAALNDVMKFPDFYTMSECRDLLFHSQEQNFTIPRIEAFLINNNLQFLGFQVDVNVRDRFARRFSREQEADLLLWHQFEIENSDTFKGMYQFVVQKGLPIVSE